MKENAYLTHMISLEIQAFLLDRKARGLAKNTMLFYTQELDIFAKLLEKRGIEDVEQINANHIRECMVELGETRNDGGVSAWYKAVRAFLHWFEDEGELPGFRNPISKIRPPKVSQDPLPGINTETLKKLVDVCDKDHYGTRNKAILLFLYDTGVRVSECCDLKFKDIDMKSGAVSIIKGKGGKSRTVFMGVACRKQLIRYLRFRRGIQPEDPLFTHRSHTQFRRDGIEAVIDSCSKAAGIAPPPSPHDFRRAFTKESLKRTDVVSVARMLGHSNTSLVWRYYQQNKEDLQREHELSSPADHL